MWGGKIQGAAGGNFNKITLRRVHFRDNANGHRQNDGNAVAGCIKVFNFAKLVAQDLICEQDSAVGLWMDGDDWRDAVAIDGLFRNLGGPAQFFELGKNGISTGATIINCATGFLLDADNISVLGAAIFGTPQPVLVRPGPRNGRARGVTVSIESSYIEFKQSSRYGMMRTWANNGPRGFASDHNTFAGLDPSWKVFRWASFDGGPIRSLNLEEWQALGFDQNTVLA